MADDDFNIPDDPMVGQMTGSSDALAQYAGPYVTDMLGRGAALADQPYYAYEGPLTAGESALQAQAFQGLAGLAAPDTMGAFTPGSFTEEGTAQTYMNPYLQQVLDPQLDELRRQAEISRTQQAGKLTRAGAFGGSRQQLAESELTRNLLDKMAGVTGKTYADAFNRAQDQFNIEQKMGQQAQTLANQYGLEALAAQQRGGDIQRGIEQEGIFADRLQFEEERDFPYKQVQYMQSLLQGLPLEAQQISYAQPSTASNLMGGAGGILELLELLGFGGEKKKEGE
tara:strand:- start:73 stop:921 length:849 start_codon:yes stop_codon:yes gene_type:complete